MNPTPDTLDRLRQRAERLVQVVNKIQSGEGMPAKVMDDFVRIMEDGCKQYFEERTAHAN